jgi:hypothetical protein
MEKIFAVALISVLTISLAIGLVTLVSTDLSSNPCPEICHFVWDGTDQIWYCIGSANNCCCSRLK